MAREKRVPLMLTFLLFSGAALAASAQSTPQWTKNTVVVDGNTAQNALVSVSTDGHVLVFNTTDSRIVNLTAGQVLFLQDMGARRVVGVLKQGPLTAIATNAAALTDLIDNGTIQFPTHSSNPSILDQQDTNVGPGMDHLTGEIDDWQYTVKGDSNNNDLDFSFDAEKHLNGLDASVKGDGHLTNAGFSFAADIHSAKLQSLLFTAPLNGSLKVDWAARTTGSNSGIGEKRLKMPAFFKEIFVADHLRFFTKSAPTSSLYRGWAAKKMR
jgi:hypothetical protein